MYYTLAHFRWKPHIFQKNGFSIKKWKTIYSQSSYGYITLYHTMVYRYASSLPGTVKYLEDFAQAKAFKDEPWGWGRLKMRWVKLGGRVTSEAK